MDTVTFSLSIVCAVELAVIVSLVRDNKTLRGLLCETANIADAALKLARDANSDLKSLIDSSSRFRYANLVRRTRGEEDQHHIFEGGTK